MIRFGVFELDPAAGELCKAGRRVRLQHQPLQVLAALVERPGQIVTREELRSRLWSADTFVDFDTGLNRCVKKIREALGDSAESPRFVETMPKRGYRFIAPVDHSGPGGKFDGAPPAAIPTSARRYSAVFIAALLALVVALISMTWRWAVTSPQIKSIAVLPFENFSSDASDEYFADGVTDGIITELAQTDAVSVVSRTSVVRYRHSKKALRLIAQELKADAIVEGTITRSGEQVRITAQLIDARHDRHLWAQHYERSIGNILALQDSISTGIADEIRGKLWHSQRASTRLARSVDPQAYEAFLKGSYFRRMNPVDLGKSITYFTEAIRIDPSYAEAHAGLSHSYYVEGILGFERPTTAYPAAETAAKKALALDSHAAEAYNTLADVAKGYDRNWQAAEVYYKRALDLNPSYAIAHAGYADLLARGGRVNEALAEAERARRLDPVSSQTQAFFGFILYQARQFDRAIEECNKAIELDPSNPGARWFLALALERRNRTLEAIEQLKRAVQDSHGGAVYVSALGHAYGLAGRRNDAIAELNNLEMRSRNSYVSAFDIAMIYIGLDDRESALQWLQRAYDERAMRLEQVTEPSFDALRSDGRFRALVQRIGLPVR